MNDFALIFALLSTENGWIGNKKGSLAQLVQSICLTSRGSAVRTRQLPPRGPNWGLFDKEHKIVSVAQLVEQMTLNHRVHSSSLCGDTGKALRSIWLLSAFTFAVCLERLLKFNRNAIF